MISGELESPDVETKPFSNSILHKTEDQNNPTSRAPGYSPPHLEERTPRKTLTVVNADGELEEVKLKTHLFQILKSVTILKKLSSFRYLDHYFNFLQIEIKPRMFKNLVRPILKRPEIENNRTSTVVVNPDGEVKEVLSAFLRTCHF